MEILQNDNLIVHGLWIGQTLNPTELLCIQSYLSAGHQFYLWAYQEIENIPEQAKKMDANLVIPYKNVFSYTNPNKFGHGKGSYAGFSDIFRYKLLYEYGGWWTDMDVTCIKQLNFTEPYIFRINGNKGIVGNLLKCPAKSALMKYCYERAINEMHPDNTEWLLPINILNDGISNFNLSQYQKLFTNEDSWPEVTSFLLTNKKPDDKWFAIHWMNEEWRRFELRKDAFIRDSGMDILLNLYKIPHQILDKKSEKNLRRKLGKWNYRYINIIARMRWYSSKILSKFQ